MYILYEKLKIVCYPNKEIKKLAPTVSQEKLIFSMETILFPFVDFDLVYEMHVGWNHILYPSRTTSSWYLSLLRYWKIKNLINVLNLCPFRKCNSWNTGKLLSFLSILTEITLPVIKRKTNLNSFCTYHWISFHLARKE